MRGQHETVGYEILKRRPEKKSGRVIKFQKTLTGARKYASECKKAEAENTYIIREVYYSGPYENFKKVEEI